MPQDPAQFVQTHLGDELEYMLVAATTWCAADRHQPSDWPRYTLATAECAAFTHQRNLYEVLCGTGHAGITARDHLCHPDVLHSELYTKWRTPLNYSVNHLARRWRKPAPVQDQVHLKQLVAAFASDIVRLWGELADHTSLWVVAEVLVHRRDDAVRVARIAAKDMGVPDLDWSLPDPFLDWGERKWWPNLPTDNNSTPPRNSKPRNGKKATRV
jgi:hypothetical protein